MIVDGRAIAADIYRELQNTITHMEVVPHMTVFTCAPDFATQKYLKLKHKKAQMVGIGINVIEFPREITTEEVVQSVLHAQMQTDGIVIQLPFPDHIDIEAVLQSVSPQLDMDAIHYDGTQENVLPPVVGAIKEIAERNDVLFAAMKVVVIGEGRLVGAPAALWAQKQGAQVEVLSKKTKDVAEKLKTAHIIISGAGAPKLITPGAMAQNALIFDAGTSEDGGVLVGDADPLCAEKAALFTPTPGGIGPITIAILLRNLIRLSLR